jgi:GTP-binding protein
MIVTNKMRNIAIIAHVDHGKTTLVDKLLGAKTDRVMDSNALESERGITILAKCTSVQWNGYEINILDTPGHRDFGGEVERALSMADGVLLLVDATEGIEQQTKFVARKAIEFGLPVLCAVNKVDRPGNRAEEVHLEMLEFLAALDPTADHTVLYVSGKAGIAAHSLEEFQQMAEKGELSMGALLETIVSEIPAPHSKFEDTHTRMSVRIIDRDKHLGKLLLGKIESGKLVEGQQMHAKSEAGLVESGRITKILKRYGTELVVVEQAVAGDIVSVAGFTGASVGDTLVSHNSLDPIHIPAVDPPTLSMIVEPNTSPMLGKEGTKLTSQLLQERLLREAQIDVSLSVSISGISITLAGRGEMHLGVLLENLRREGFEMTVYPPEVCVRDGKEPWESLVLEMDAANMGDVIAELNLRRAEIQETREVTGGRFRIECNVAAKNILGYRSKFLTQTQGAGIWSQGFAGYRDRSESVKSQRNGVLVSTTKGTVTAYALDKLSARGEMFVSPGTEVYEGMIIGEHNREGDLDINPVINKKLTNVRAVGKDDGIQLTPPRIFSLEDVLLYIEDGECVEITPKRFRLRKKWLTANERKKNARN